LALAAENETVILDPSTGVAMLEIVGDVGTPAGISVITEDPTPEP
jgi:hypothetical protein